MELVVLSVLNLRDISVGAHLIVLQKDLGQEQIWEGCATGTSEVEYRVLPDT